MKRDRDRDAAIDRMLGAGLRAATGTADACPEASQLAAFVEGGLSSGERDTVERHVAACQRCQHALALIGSAAPAKPALSPAPRYVTWLRWAMPVTGVAVVVLLYIGLRSTIVSPVAPGAARPVAVPAARSAAEPSRVADNRPVSAPQAGAPPPAPSTEAGHAEFKKQVARAETPYTAVREKARPTGAANAVATAPAAPAEQVAPTQLELRANAAAEANRPVAGNLAVFRDQAPAQQQQQQAQQQRQEQTPPVAAPGAPPAVVDRLSVVGGAAGQPLTAAKQAAAATRLDRFEEVPSAAATPLIIAGPGWSVRWRLESGGGISRSRDGGATWQLQSYRAASTLLAGSAPTSNVCWLVGSAGTVLLTTDGDRWTPRPFPERVDLVAVGARDRQHATVTTRDGRRFVTEDGGATWRQTQ